MPLENDFVPFATAGGANTETAAAWLADATRSSGFIAGILPSIKLNTGIKQASLMSSMLGNLIATYSGFAAYDTDTVAALTTKFLDALTAVVAPYTLQVALTDTGTQNHVIATFTPTSPTVTAGQAFLFIPAYSNNGPSVLEANGQGPFTIVNPGGGGLSSGQLTAGAFSLVAYDGTNMQLLFSQTLSEAVLNVPADTVMSFTTGLNAISANDLIQLGGPQNEAYSVAVTDYASVYSTKTFLPAVTYATDTTGLPGLSRWPLVQDSQGNLYTLFPQTGITATVQKSSPAGVAISSIQLGADTSGLLYGAKLLMLSNGNMAAIYALQGGLLKYAVFDTALNIIQNEAAVASVFNVANVCYFDATPLANGGFAVVFQTVAATSVQVATYNNSGVSVIAATTIASLSGGTNYTVYLRLTQLTQTGNQLLLVGMRTLMYYGSSGSGNRGTAFATVTVGSSSLATTATGAVDTSVTTGFLEIKADPTGCFCVAVPNQTDMIANTYSNAGTLATSGSFAYTLNPSTYINFRLLDDGNQFWLVYVDATSGVDVVAIPFSGTPGSVVNLGSGAGVGGANWSMDAAICNGVITVFFGSTGMGAQVYTLIGMPNISVGITLPYVVLGWTSLGLPSTASGAYWPRVVHLGDWTVAMLYDQVTNGELFWTIVKVATSAIEGVALNSNPANDAGNALTTFVGPGTYPCNAVKGTQGITVNHTVASPPGNQISLYTSGVALKGISAPTAIRTVPCNPFVPINCNDLVEMGLDGYAYACKVSDYCTQGKSGSLIAPTELVGGSIATNASSPIASCTNFLGQSIVVTTAGSVNTGIQLARISSTGIVINNLSLPALISGVAYDPHLDVLSNGNIVFSATGSNNYIYVYIVDPLLKGVIFTVNSNGGGPWTVAEQAYFQFMMRAHPLGGFFIVYQQTSGQQSRFVFFTNAGAAVFGPTTISAWTGTAGNVYQNARVLSNGNIAISCISAWTVTIGHYIGVISPGGSIVKALTHAGAGAVGNTVIFPPDIAVHPGGYFATTVWGAGSYAGYVWSNAGTLQGSAFTSGASTPVLVRPKILCDGTGFWMHYDQGSGSVQTFLAYLPITGGGGAATWAIWVYPYASNAVYTDAYFENGNIIFIVAGYLSASTWGVSYAVWNTAVRYQTVGLTSIATPGFVVYWPHCWPVGDFSFQYSYILSASNGQYFGATKWGNSAILGVAAAAAVPGQLVPVNTAVAEYDINVNNAAAVPSASYSAFNVDPNSMNVLFSSHDNGLFGSPVQQFDHTYFASPTASTVYGSRGTIAGSAVTLSGLTPPVDTNAA